jgi:transposase
MASIKDKRLSSIPKFFKKVENSGLSAKKYFATHETPMSIVQYFRLKKRFHEHGVAGLIDQRHAGNARKVASEQVKLVRGVFAYNRQLSSKALQHELRSQWKIDLGPRRIDQLRQQFNLTRVAPEPDKKKEPVQLAGIEIFSALAHYVGILKRWSSTIQQRLHHVKQTQRYDEDSGGDDHNYARHRDGTFSSRYNRIAHVRRMKFASIEEKIKDKDFSRLSLYQRQAANLNRKNLAVLFLPLVTNNGAVRSLDKPLGNALAYACGYNYKTTTIDKYLRELKYLQVSTDFIHCNARFWSRFWKKYDVADHQLACYYIDGNVKPLWSSKRCRKGKVSMLGRIMNCLEQVVVHDGWGRPIYFQTFSGYADLQNHALQAMEQLEELFAEDHKARPQKSRCTRALIFDSAANAVQTLRAFSNSKYHYITILDSNQIHPRKFKHLSPPQRYRYGEATLIDCEIELIDSKEPKYIYESRAVQVQWDNGKSCCLATSIPETLLAASEVVKAYFDRWPYCEKQFAMMNAAVCFFQIVGYGKKLLDDDTMLARMKQLQTELRQLHDELKEPLAQISDKEQQLQKLFIEERRLKENSTIKNGKRIQSQRNKEALETCQRQIGKKQREIKAVEKPFRKQFNLLRQQSKEFARIQGKKEVYYVDVELDQLLTSFRLTLANLLAFLAKEILDETAIEMNTLIQSILFLPGRIEHHPGRRKVYIKKNNKDPKFMMKLAKGLAKLNSLNIRHSNGTVYEFVLE